MSLILTKYHISLLSSYYLLKPEQLTISIDLPQQPTCQPTPAQLKLSIALPKPPQRRRSPAHPPINNPPSVTLTSRPIGANVEQLQIPIQLQWPVTMRTCPVQLKLYIPFQPRSQKATTVTKNTSTAHPWKDAPINSVSIDRPSRKALRSQPVLAPQHSIKSKEPVPAKLREVPEPTKAGGNKRAISLLSIINPPKRTVTLPPFSASPEQSKKKKKAACSREEAEEERESSA